MPSFKDIGKQTSGDGGLFDADEYATTREIEFSANEDNVNFSATTTQSIGDDGSSSVDASFEYETGNFKLEADTDSAQKFSYNNFKFGGFKNSFTYSRTGGKKDSDKLEFKAKCSEYNVTFKAASNIAKRSLDTTTEIAYAKDAFTIGAKVGFNPIEVALGKTAFGAQYSQGDNTFALSSAAKNKDGLFKSGNVSFFRKINDSTSAGADVSYSKAATGFRFGASKVIDGKSSLKGYVNEKLDVFAKYSYQLTKRLNASAAFQFNARDPSQINSGFKLNFE